jgi:hypothetical protein
VKKLVALVLSVVAFVFLGTQSAVALPTTTSWTNGRLNEMVRYTGPLTTSISGTGFLTQTGNISVEKPAGGTVIAAFLTSASNVAAATPTDVKINGQTVTYSHRANTTVGWNFANYFADVTALVKPDIDAHAAGTFTLPLDEGTSPGSGALDGEELVVIFNDPAKINTPTTVVVVFGSARQSGDSFTLNFPALTDLSRQSATLSLGISFSSQSAGNRSQQSNIKMSTSSRSTLEWISQTAGGQNDGTGSDGALITVGGIGDSLALPALNTTADDDELYGLGSFLTQGDTSITINTVNASLNDNVFQAVLVLDGVQATGAVSVGDPVQSTIPAPSVSTPTTPASTPVALAKTGANMPDLFAVFALLAIGAGTIAVMLTRRRRTSK